MVPDNSLEIHKYVFIYSSHAHIYASLLAHKLRTVITFGHSSILKMTDLKASQFFIYGKMKQEVLWSPPDQHVHSYAHQLYWS